MGEDSFSFDIPDYWGSGIVSGYAGAEGLLRPSTLISDSSCPESSSYRIWLVMRSTFSFLDIESVWFVEIAFSWDSGPYGPETPSS